MIQNSLVDVFKHIGNIFLCIEVYFEVQAPLTAAMSELIGKITIEVLNTLPIVTKMNEKSQTSPSVFPSYSLEMCEFHLMYIQKNIWRNLLKGWTLRMQ